MSPEYCDNHSNLAEIKNFGSYITTYCILWTFISLLILPICAYFKDQINRFWTTLQVSRYFYCIWNYFTQVFHLFIGLYYVMKECRQLNVLDDEMPQHLEVEQKLPETLPPLDEFTRSTMEQLILHPSTEESSVLVNTARALKFFESYGDRQAKLWKVLTKYDKLPDHFHDLQTTLQTEFAFLKTATSKNIDQFQEAINLQKMYTTSLCSHINTIYAKLVQLERQIQTHCLYPHSQTDSVQINTPEYNSDIDSQIDTLPDLQTNRTDFEPESVQNPAEYSPHQDAGQFREQYQDRQRFQSEDIPELEDEDWEDRQFTDADLIDHHNTKTESNQI